MTENQVRRTLKCRQVDDALTSGLSVALLFFLFAMLVASVGFVKRANSIDWDFTRTEALFDNSRPGYEEVWLDLLPLFAVLCVICLLYHLTFQTLSRREIPLEHEPFVRRLAEEGLSAASFQMAMWANAKGSDFWFLHWLDVAASQGFRDAKKLSRRIRS